MELSEAIKAGAKLAPQAFGVLKVARYRKGREPKLATCALGAAKMALHATSLGAVQQRYPLLGLQVEEVPCGCRMKARDTVAEAIMHLNDRHKWRRETIAAWVKHLESK